MKHIEHIWILFSKIQRLETKIISRFNKNEIENMFILFLRLQL